jgi:glycosyltransferase involved in cell wall biosynthesis
MAKKNILRVGYISPGWPLKNFPNGIVTYIQNVIYKQEDKIDAVILTNNLIAQSPDKNLVLLDDQSKHRTYLDKIIDIIIEKFSQYTKFDNIVIRCKRRINLYAKIISHSVNQLDTPLDILEIEETYGTAHFLLNKTNVPIVTRIHGPWFIHGPIMGINSVADYNYRVFCEGEAIRKSHGVTAPCQDVLDRVRVFYGITLPNAKVIPNPVLEVPQNKQWQYDATRKPFILVVARFDLHKGGDLAIDAFRHIAQKNDGIELLFVGPDRGLSIDGKYLQFSEYLEYFIPEEFIKSRIKFLGHCDQEKIAELRKTSLVTMVCSRYENFPLSLLEALSFGCPTVATSVGGIKEIIIDGHNGLLANVESTEDIASKVIELINNPEKMKLISRNAVEDCLKRFSPEVVAAQSVDFYKSILAENKSSNK